MTITYSALPAGQPRQSTQDETWRRTYTRHFLAVTDSPLIGPKAVREACPVAIGQTYAADGESDAGSYAVRITATEDGGDGDGCQWIVTVEYGPFNPLEFAPQDPLVARPRINFSTARFQTVATKDIDDVPVLNSAGDPFDPPVMLDQSRPFMTIVRNEASFAPLLANDYKDAINAAGWFGMPEFTWKCLDITGEEAQDPDGGRYWVVTYEFELNPDTWIFKVMDVGLREVNASSKKVKITDSNGSDVDAPWPLNEDGTKKAVGAAADFLEFHIYREADFSILNLDSFYFDLVSSGLLT